MNVALCDSTWSIDGAGALHCDGNVTQQVYQAPTAFSDYPSATYAEAFGAGFVICLTFWGLGYGCRKIIEAIHS